MTPDTEEYAPLRTGFSALDAALGIGGYPAGRVVEIYGPDVDKDNRELCLRAVCEAQTVGGVAGWIDASGDFSPTSAARAGLDLNALLIVQPESLEEALRSADRLVGSGSTRLVVIDAANALTTPDDPDGSLGLRARLWSQGMRRLTATAHRSRATVLVINACRARIGVAFGDRPGSPGGNAIKFYASVRLEVRRTAAGGTTLIKVVKNKCAAPFRTAELSMHEGESK